MSFEKIFINLCGLLYFRTFVGYGKNTNCHTSKFVCKIQSWTLFHEVVQLLAYNCKILGNNKNLKHLIKMNLLGKNCCNPVNIKRL